jgi:Flp pilus assembly protein TadG
MRGVARDRGGNVALIFALCLVPVILFIGAGVDLANAQRIRQQLQDATDSAVLAVARDGLRLTDAQLQPEADAYLKASYDYKRFPYKITKLTFDRTTVTATLDTTASVPTSFMQIAGIRSVPISASAVSKGLGFEVALVLDTSGSMGDPAGSGGSKISALRTAASSFLDAMFGTQATSQRVTIGIVPFAASVNVGTANKSAAWMDTSGSSSIAKEDFQSGTTKTRWNLFDDLKNTSWAGCVVSRTSNGNYDVNDAPSTGGDTLFDPWFAPDESDLDNFSTSKPKYDLRSPARINSRNNASIAYPNNYLNDEGGNCTGTDTSLQVSDSVKQARVCKYKGVKPSGDGPNYLCDSTPITPLTGTRAGLDTAIKALQAAGNTNILEGLMWGWRVLSPTAPFTEGKAYTAPNNRKVIVLMTDGENNLGGTGYNDINYSNYSSYGYAIRARVGVKSSDNNTLTTALNTKTQTACTNAKAAGMTIYTIAFGADASGSVNLLRNCASDPSFFYQPQNSSDLQPVFLEIAESINRLRIAQ